MRKFLIRWWQDAVNKQYGISFLFLQSLVPLVAFLSRQREKRADLQACDRPVVSIGNLSMGGTGKTPLTAYLASYLFQKGKRVVILTRGYKREAKEAALLLPGEKLPPWKQVGDEAILLRHLAPKIPVVVSKDRFSAALLAQKKLNPDIFLLDDGLHQISLFSDYRILVIDSTHPPYHDRLFPAGFLRHGSPKLSEIHKVILSRMKWTKDRQTLLDFCLRNFKKDQILFSTEKIISLRSARGKKALKEGTHIHLLCAIANPFPMIRELEEMGFRIGKRFLFPDHYTFQVKDLKGLDPEVPIVTTSKDWVRLDGLLQSNLELRRLRFFIARQEFSLPDSLIRSLAEDILKLC